MPVNTHTIHCIKGIGMTTPFTRIALHFVYYRLANPQNAIYGKKDG